EQRVWGPLTSVSAKKETIAESKEKSTYVKKEDLAEQVEEKAHSLILLSLSNEILYEVADQETTSGLWLKLEKLYMSKSICNKLLLKRRLFGLHMKEGMPLKDHLDELNLILMELRDIYVKVEDEDVAMILLASLPPSYESFVNSLSFRKECIMMEEVKSSLHLKELRFKAPARTEEVNGAGLFVSNSVKNGKKKKDKGRTKLKSIQRTSAIIVKNRVIGRKIVQRKGTKYRLLQLSKKVEVETTSSTIQNKDFNDEASKKYQEERDEDDDADLSH
ncbi:gag-polypeptide of LTR copia-type, partial [Sesbania bispinosa]